MEIPKLYVKFERFLFFNELKALKGLDYLLEKVNFGNIIYIEMEEKMTLSMFKNDFFFFMTVLFNNISFDDERDKMFM